MSDELKRLAFALDKYPEKVQAVPVAQLVMESARKNDKRPAFLKIAVPDEVVKNLRGDPAHRSLLLLIDIPHDVGERAESPIVLPGELRD